VSLWNLWNIVFKDLSQSKEAGEIFADGLFYINRCNANGQSDNLQDWKQKHFPEENEVRIK
jgi:hypothetical protein